MSEKQKIKAYKEKQFLIFEFEDGKSVSYNLATAETIGKTGKPVKGIQPQLAGYSLLDMIASFEDENYSRFLNFLDRNFINRSESSECYGRRVNKCSNIGTFLSKVKFYSRFEQIFSAGIKKVDRTFTGEISDIPSGLIKLCRENGNINLTDEVLCSYKQNPDFFAWAVSNKFMYLGTQDVISLIIEPKYYRIDSMSYSRGVDWYFKTLLVWGYSYKHLLEYLDGLVAFEALTYYVIKELFDYARMMRQISPFYEKYPKNFLTTHKIAIRNYERLKQEFEEDLFKNIRDQAISDKLEYKSGDYIMVYPKTTQEIKDEAVQQNNCVASYIKDVMDSKCHILFMRHKDEPEKSLVTIEVSGNKVIQAKEKYNQECNQSEKDFIDKYNKYLEKLADKERKKVA